MSLLCTNSTVEYASMHSDGNPLLSLPIDILRHHITPKLPSHTLIVCGFVNKLFRVLAIEHNQKIGTLHSLNNKRYAITFASKDRDWTTVKWLHKHLGHPLDNNFAKYAAKDGNLEMLKWSDVNGFHLGINTFMHAAKKGHLEVLQWANNNILPIINIHIANSAAEGGQLDVLKWLYSLKCPWNQLTCAFAARSGRLDVLQWLREKGFQWNEMTCVRAAESGQLHILQWARANGCPWSSETCDGAATHGHLEILQWARANGCPWNEFTCLRAAMFGHLAVLQWARANGCPWDANQCLLNSLDYPEVNEWIQANRTVEA